ncbi:ribonuclease Z [Sessilibacter corallicola]|uniref:Ribonuclease Z n=1 Tax=Sessilibacter corallicola TaxID=2904075 RepID=A0ABQ0AEP5_9GAMM
MEIQFLGTSSGVPTNSRNVSATAVVKSNSSEWCLVDCGEATQHQVLKTSLSPQKLAAIFITHIHGDHCYGLPGLLASVGIGGRTEPLIIVAPEKIKEWFLATQQFTDLHLPYDIVFYHSEDLGKVCVGELTVSITELSHRVPSYAYVFTEIKKANNIDQEKLNAAGIPRGPLWGKLQSGEDVIFNGRTVKAENFIKPASAGRKIIICGDNDNPDLLKNDIADCQLLIHEATYSKEFAEKAKMYGHSYAEQVAKFAHKSQLPNLILTHFSSRYQIGAGSAKSIDELEHEALNVYEGRLFLASDLQRFCLSNAGELKKIDKI